MKPTRILYSLLGLVLICAGALLGIRSLRNLNPRHNDLPTTGPGLATLSFLKLNQVVAKVGSIELRGQDLRESLQLDFHGEGAHSNFTEAEISSKVGTALEKLIEDEVLAQEARRQGFKTPLRGVPARQELARSLLTLEISKLSPLSDAEIRGFYKNHGEKFYIPPSVQVREIFLPYQGTKNKTDKKDPAYVLAQDLSARISKGESLEALAKTQIPEVYQERAQVHIFSGGVMEPAHEQRVLRLGPGEVLGPIHVAGGYSVFQGVAQIRSRLIPFYQAQEKIKTYLESLRVEETRKQLVDKLQKQISVQRFGLHSTVASAKHS